MKNRTIFFCLANNLLLVILLFLPGCAGSGTSLPKEELSGAQPVLVSRLDNGQVGFEIKENGRVGEALHDLFARGVTDLESGNYDAAVDTFKAVTVAAPFLSAPYINLAIAYIRSDKDALAEEPLKKALARISGHPLASHEYGLLLRRAGRFDEARTVYESSLKVFPEYFPLRKNLGVLCDLYLNDLACASRQYKMFLDAQPDDEQVKLWLVEVEGRRDR